MKRKFKTVEDIQNFQSENSHMSYYEIFKTIQDSNEIPYPERPKKPILQSKHTSDEAIAYANELKEYEVKKLEYDKKGKLHDSEGNRLSNLLVDYMREESGLNTHVPEKYRDKVYSYAYEQSHSSGFYEVYQTLQNLVEIFE